MQMHPVASSNLVSVGYDAETQTLRVRFRNSLYDYYNVPQFVFEGLMNASSKGSYHAAHIKNRYRHSRIG